MSLFGIAFADNDRFDLTVYFGSRWVERFLAKVVSVSQLCAFRLVFWYVFQEWQQLRYLPFVETNGLQLVSYFVFLFGFQFFCRCLDVFQFHVLFHGFPEGDDVLESVVVGQDDIVILWLFSQQVSQQGRNLEVSCVLCVFSGTVAMDIVQFHPNLGALV